jgi:23S rRNA (pseudouridine1915-N3)-methyltransferase
LLATLETSDHVVLLDEHGTERTSIDFSQWLQRRMASGVKRLVFVVGGPYGFSPEVYHRANEKISLSKMTFPHELVRLIFAEQLYRAFSILRHEPYHHE